MRLQNKKVIVITNSSSYEPRAEWIGELFKKQGAHVLWVETDFIHREKVKKVRSAPDHIYIDTVPYRKNLSVRRLYSQYDFAKKVEKLLEKEKADLIYMILPANSLAAVGDRLKRKMNTAMLVFDVLDLWPESLGGKKFQKLWPFQYWRRLRDDHLNAADLVITECRYFQEFVKAKKEKTAVVYWPKEVPENWKMEDTAVETNGESNHSVIHFAYLGSINNIIDKEGITGFLEAVKSMKPVCLHVVGDGEKKALFEETLKSKGIDAHFYGAVYEEEKKKEIFSKCAFGINMMKPGVCVGLTMKSIDYFCYGLPLVNNIPGDTWELVEKEQIGINYQQERDAEKLLTLFDNVKMKEMKCKMQQLYTELFTPEAVEKVIRERVFPLLEDRGTKEQSVK